MKKQKLNKTLYDIHLELANFWDNSGILLKKNTNDKLELEMQNKYKNLDKKLKKLS
jgi:hypothetical protein